MGVGLEAWPPHRRYGGRVGRELHRHSADSAALSGGINELADALRRTRRTPAVHAAFHP